MGNLLPPSSADKYFKARNILFCHSEWALSSTSGTVVTLIWIHIEFSIIHLCYLDRTRFLHLTDFTTLTLSIIEDRNILSHDSKVIQVWFYTVIWASSYSDLKLMWKNYIVISYIEELMKLLRETESIA